MMLDLLVDQDEQMPEHFTDLFSSVNLVRVDPNRPPEAQVSEIEARLGWPSLQRMLIYSNRYDMLGTVLSRRYLNSARIDQGPLKLAGMRLTPDHLSDLPNSKERNRVLFLTPHCDEAYIAAILPHKLIGDQVFLHSFTFIRTEKNRIRRAYQMLGLEKDDYSLGSLQDNKLFREKQAIKQITKRLLADFKPTVVFSVLPRGANFDHLTVSHVAREVVLNHSTADLIYGYVIQSRNRNPSIFPIFSKSIYRMILQAFGKQGLGNIFQNYLPFLRYYMQTYSEPIARMIGDKRMPSVYSLPLEAERISVYRIPNLLTKKVVNRLSENSIHPDIGISNGRRNYVRPEGTRFKMFIRF